VDLTDDYAVRNLIHGIAVGLTGNFSLVLSGCTGYAWGYVSGIPAAEKARITAITLPDTVTHITSGPSTTGAFAGYTSLAAVTAPGVTDLDAYAFSSCTALATLTLPMVQTIGNYAFSYTGTQALALTLGDTPPTVGTLLFYGVSVSKAVTVKRPASAAGNYGSEPSNTTDNNWANAFRGKGWNKDTDTYGTGTVNSYITVIFQDS
jgi:hypothetical protein